MWGFAVGLFLDGLSTGACAPAEGQGLSWDLQDVQCFPLC